MRTDEKKQDLYVKEWATLVDKIKEGKYKLPIDVIIVNGKNTSITITGVISDNGKSQQIEVIYRERIGNVTSNKEKALLVSRDFHRFKYGKDDLNKYIMLLDE